MADGIIETLVEFGIRAGVGRLVDGFVGPAMDDAARGEVADFLADVVGEPLEDLAEIRDFGDIPDGVTDLARGVLTVADFVARANEIHQNDTLSAPQKEALTLFDLLGRMTPFLSGDPGAVAEAWFDLFNRRQAELDRLFDEHPDQLQRGGDMPSILRPGQPVQPFDQVSPVAPATPASAGSPAAADAGVIPVNSGVRGAAGGAMGSIHNTCPLILDLDGDGIAVSALGPEDATGSAVFFDLDSNGFAERTAWVLGAGVSNLTGTGGDDAFLVQDRNGNGTIDNESEMFCVTDVYANGFANLATLDLNADGQVDAADPGFAGLRLWLDVDGDGITDAGELQSLATHNVTALGVRPAAQAPSLLNGNLITAQAQFLRGDGSAGTLTDLWFTNDNINTRYLGDYTLDMRTLLLPTLRGYGNLTDLHVAMSLDPVLMGLVGNLATGFTLADLVPGAGFDAGLRGVLFRWAGVDQIATGARGPHIDARVLEFMEKIAGSRFGELAGLGVTDPEGYWQADGIRAAFDSLFNLLKAHVVFQIGGQAIHGQDASLYDPVTGTLAPAVLDAAGVAQLRIVALGAADPAGFWTAIGRLLAQVTDPDDLTAAETSLMTDAVAATSDTTWGNVADIVRLELASISLSGTPGPDTLQGGPGDDFLNGAGAGDLLLGEGGRDALHGGDGDDDLRGGPGDDDLHGNAGNDTISGGTGDDSVYGNAGDDLYLWNLGDGSDYIAEDGIAAGSGTDTLQLGPGITLADLTFGMGFSDLTITIGDATLTLTSQFDGPGYEIERLVFADGSERTLLSGFDVVGTPGEDYLQAYAGRTASMAGLGGNDELYGSEDDDVYLWNRGDGSDVIYEEGGADTIRLGAGITPGEVGFRLDSSDLHIDIGSDTITLASQFDGAEYAVEQLVFADGTVRSLTGAFDVVGTPGEDYLQAYAGRTASMAGLGGDDELYGSEDDDVYLWSRGDGSDVIYEEGGSDTIRLGAGITSGEVGFRLDSSDLHIDIGSDTITLASQFDGAEYAVEQLVFADGTVRSLTGAFDVVGTPGEDYLQAYAGRTASMAGLGGDDELYGSAAGDVYLWNRGDGSDVIYEEGGSDTIRLGAGITPGEVGFRLDSSDLHIDIGSDTITLASQFDGAEYAVEQLVFADGTVRSLTGAFDVVGTPGEDYLQAYAGRTASMAGLGGNDELYGSEDDDVYLWNRGDGSDVIYEQGGADTIRLGAGITPGEVVFRTDFSSLYIGIGAATITLSSQFDAAEYAIERLVFADGSAQSLTGALPISGTADDDYLTIDPARMTSLAGMAGDDELTGSAQGDVLLGGPGNDTILGLGGSDWITPGPGSDSVNGGAGRDMISFVDLPDTPGRSNIEYRLTLDLGAGRATTSGADVYTIRNVERVTGSIFADYIRGSTGDDEIRGLGDYDWFVATTGNDTYDGGTGQDMISYVEWQNAAANTVGDPFETDGVPPLGAAVTGVVVNLSDPSANTNLAAGDVFTSVERITGSGRQDVFIGDAGQNDFRGLGDFDWFVSSDGGRERYFGGDGVDTVTYYNAPGAITASRRNGALVNGEETGYGTQGWAARDLYFEIENLVGSRFSDSLTGNNGRNQINGLDGDDIIFGYGGIDYLKGGAGNDTINGGAGSDYALFDGNRADYTLTKTSSSTVTVSGADGTDSLIDVEYFVFDDAQVTIWELPLA